MKTVKQCDDTEPHNKHEWFSETTSLNDSFECPGIKEKNEDHSNHRQARKGLERKQK